VRGGRHGVGLSWAGELNHLLRLYAGKAVRLF
jgi:hypothetical protein